MKYVTYLEGLLLGTYKLFTVDSCIENAWLRLIFNAAQASDQGLFLIHILKTFQVS
jgi:hypothetical protein